MNYKISKIAQYFEKLPGIGPRQAKRFVYSLLMKDQKFLEEFGKSVFSLKREITTCAGCRRFFEVKNDSGLCGICSDRGRDRASVLIVEKDIDLENVERAGFYNGLYFVLGGLVPLPPADVPSEARIKDFFEKIKTETGLKEIILAFNATLEGDNTASYLEKILEPIIEKRRIKTSRLGRGLSTGTELEYSDKETIESAFKNRR